MVQIVRNTIIKHELNLSKIMKFDDKNTWINQKYSSNFTKDKEMRFCVIELSLFNQ